MFAESEHLFYRGDANNGGLNNGSYGTIQILTNETTTNCRILVKIKSDG